MVAAPKEAWRWAINKLEPDRLDTVILASKWDKNLILTGIVWRRQHKNWFVQWLWLVMRQCPGSIQKGRPVMHIGRWRRLPISNREPVSCANSNSVCKVGKGCDQSLASTGKLRETYNLPSDEAGKAMDGAMQPGGGGTLWSIIQVPPPSPHNWVNGAGSCGHHGSAVPAAPSIDGHIPGSWGRTITADSSRNWCDS